MGNLLAAGAGNFVGDSALDPAGAGILYYARGYRWVEEAIRSARSVKREMPDIPTAVVSDEPLPRELFDIQIKAPPDIGVKPLKMWSLRRTPFKKTVYLDTDTFLVDTIEEVFTMLSRFDIAAAVTPGWRVSLCEHGGSTGHRGVPVCFPEFNCGILAYNTNSRTDRLFADWAALHADWGGRRDQPAFRRTLYDSDIRFGVLPPHYNYRLHLPYGIWGAVKIFHGRQRNMAAVCDAINRSHDWRITRPSQFRGATIVYGPSRGRRMLWRLLRRLRRHSRGRVGGAGGGAHSAEV